MSGKVAASAETMVQHATQTQAMAAQLTGVSAFDPSIFQGPMMIGLGPIAAPYIAAYMAAMTNHVTTAMEVAAGLELHGGAVLASSQSYDDTEGSSSDSFKSML